MRADYPAEWLTVKDRVLTTSKIAAVLRCSQQVVHRLIDQGQLPGAFRVPLSRFRRAMLSAVLRYAAANDIPPDLAALTEDAK